MTICGATGHGLICGKRDPLGQNRVLERDKGKALAAHSTLNRLKLSGQGTWSLRLENFVANS
jgi:hypothetical protein